MAPRVLIPVERGVSAAPLIAQAQEEFGPGMDMFLGHVHTRDALTPEEERELSALFQEAYAARRAGLAVRVVTVEADGLQEGVSALDRTIGADVVAVRDGAPYTDHLELCFVEQRESVGVSRGMTLRSAIAAQWGLDRGDQEMAADARGPFNSLRNLHTPLMPWNPTSWFRHCRSGTLARAKINAQLSGGSYTMETTPTHVCRCFTLEELKFVMARARCDGSVVLSHMCGADGQEFCDHVVPAAVAGQVVEKIEAGELAYAANQKI